MDPRSPYSVEPELDPQESGGQSDPAEESDAHTVVVTGEIAPEIVVHKVEVPEEPVPVWAPVPLRRMPAVGNDAEVLSLIYLPNWEANE